MVVAAAVVLGAAPAGASVAVVVPDGTSEPLGRIEIAAALAARSTVWYAVHAAETARFAIVAEVSADATIEVGQAAWLQALDLVTAPRVIAPESGERLCGGDDISPLLELGGRSRAVPALATMLVEPARIEAVLSDWGLPHAGLRPTASDARLFAALFELSAGATSETVRISESAALSSFPSAYTPARNGAEVTTYVLAGGLLEPSLGSLLPAAELGVTYDLGRRVSDYRDVAQSALSELGWPAWLLEASVDTVSDWRFYAEGVALPALVEEYFEGAHAAGAFQSAPASCVAEALARLAGGEPAASDCRAAGDVEIALEGLALADVRVTRFSSLASHEPLGAVSYRVREGDVLPPIVVASIVQGPGCGDPPSLVPPPVVAPPVVASPGEPAREPPYVVDEAYYYETGEAELQCGASEGSSSGSDDDCDGDSSGSSSDDGCDGDSSGSSDSYDGESCSSDEDSYDGDGCDGGSDDDSYSGDSCDGDSGEAQRTTPRAGPLPARLARGRPIKPRLSAITVGLCAVFLAMRRARRLRARSPAL